MSIRKTILIGNSVKSVLDYLDLPEDLFWSMQTGRTNSTSLRTDCLFCHKKHDISFERTDKTEQSDRDNRIWKGMCYETLIPVFWRFYSENSKTYEERQRCDQEKARKAEEKRQAKRLQDILYGELKEEWHRAWQCESSWWAQFKDHYLDILCPPTKLEIQKKKMEAWQAEIDKAKAWRMECKKKQQQFEEELAKSIQGSGTLGMRRARLAIEELSPFGKGNGIQVQTIRSAVSSDEVNTGKVGYRSCSSAAWENAVRALEDG